MRAIAKSLFMELSLLVLWTFLLGPLLIQALFPATMEASSHPNHEAPYLTGCLFIQDANITCKWEPGNIPATHYTLEIWTKSVFNTIVQNWTKVTSNTSYTLGMNGTGLMFTYCISVKAHVGNQIFPSKTRCQNAIDETQFSPVPLIDVEPVKGRPSCLLLSWSFDNMPLSNSNIANGFLISRMEFTAQRQHLTEIENVKVTKETEEICVFKPDTMYKIRFQHRFNASQSPWSPWSNFRTGRTTEDAPSDPPAFWRHLKEINKTGCRLVTLLWKPLPHTRANGKILYYNVTCRTESSEIVKDHGSCGDLGPSQISCSLMLPVLRCSCSLTASNSAGTSPKAEIWLRAVSETEPPLLPKFSAYPLNNSHIRVNWTSADQSVSGYVVEWFAVGTDNHTLHWERLDEARNGASITEGIKAFKRYAVSLRALYGEQGAGMKTTLYIYTRQGVPTIGPKPMVTVVSANGLKLIWEPIPVEELRGFISNYTLYYRKNHLEGFAKSVCVPGNVSDYYLDNLSPGTYQIYMKANTIAGAGQAGIPTSVTLVSHEVSIMLGVILSFLLMFLVLVMIILLMNSRLKQKLFKNAPNPSDSSLAHWAPKHYLENVEQHAVPEMPYINSSEVILLSSNEPQNYDPDSDGSHGSVCRLQAYSSQCYSPAPVLGPKTTENITRNDKNDTWSSSRKATDSDTCLLSCPTTDSNVLSSQTATSLTRRPSQSLSYSLQQSADAGSDSLHLSPLQDTGSFIPPTEPFLVHQRLPVTLTHFKNSFNSPSSNSIEVISEYQLVSKD